MAPINRHGASTSINGFMSLLNETPKTHARTEAQHPDTARSNGHHHSRSLSYTDPQHVRDGLDRVPHKKPQIRLLEPGGYEEALYPLRSTADRVGQQVERFAEELDRLNPRLHLDPAERFDNTLDLIQQYQAIASETVDQLRKKHTQERRTESAHRWKQCIDRLLHDVETDDVDEANLNEQAHETLAISDTNIDDLKRWEQEERTWSLLMTLTCARHDSSDNALEERQHTEMKERKLHRYSSEPEVWKQFLLEDDLAKERCDVLRWLMESADQSGDEIDDVMEQLEKAAQRGKGLWSHGWLHSKEAIKAQKRFRSLDHTLEPTEPGVGASLMNKDRTEPLVTQLDPDSVTRQGRVLEREDESYERATWLICWEMSRRGRDWQEIHEWCLEHGEHWRAVSLFASLPTDDIPEHEETDDRGLAQSQISGDPSRALWRRMCLALARNGGLDVHERAVYGLYSGDLESVEPVCRNWDDFVFAHYHSLLLSQFERYVQRKMPDRIPPLLSRRFEGFDSVQFHGDPATVGRRIVDTLKVHQITKEEAMEPMKQLQGALLGRTVDDFFYKHGLSLAKAVNRDGPSKIIPPLEPGESEIPTDEGIQPNDFGSLRVLTHMLMVFQDLGMNIGEGRRLEIVENIIMAYMDFLRLAGKLLVIPIYASRLSPSRQPIALGRAMLDENACAQKTELIQLMFELDLDVSAIIQTQMTYSLMDHTPTYEAVAGGTSMMLLQTDQSDRFWKILPEFMSGDPDPADAQLIRSLEWYLALEGHWVETFAVGVTLYRRFLAAGHLAAARELHDRLPTSFISLHKTEALFGRSIDITTVHADDDEADFSASERRVTRHDALRAEEPRRRGSETESEEDHFRLQVETLRKHARVYIGLESLVAALIALEDWTWASQREPSDPKGLKNWRRYLQEEYDKVQATVEPLLSGWMMDVPGETDPATPPLIPPLRSIYLPDAILAYLSITYFMALSTGQASTLLTLMDLGTHIASPEQTDDLLDAFRKAGRLEMLVRGLALGARAMLQAEGERSRLPVGKGMVGLGTNLGAGGLGMRVSTRGRGKRSADEERRMRAWEVNLV
ncbi:MAG: Nucleoporin nup84 [Caeruleum heppii]|nr:MAG: Nucleoporin nup84 [Caeruleum heppii]